MQPTSNQIPEYETEPTRKTKSVKPLISLLPYVWKYRTQFIFAFVALISATGITLAVPLAIRRVIDFGFISDGTNYVDQYFVALILVAALLAVTSSLRAFIVNWIGERIVADLRKDVFSHVTILDTEFFDRSRSGEIISRLTADTTQVKSVVGVSASIALRNFALSLGAVVMMFYTSPRLTGYVLLAIPLIVLPLIAFGRNVRRKSRTAQDTLANASAYAAEAINSIRALQAYTNEKNASTRFSASIEKSFKAAIQSNFARSILTTVGIFIISSSIVVILWIGAQNVLSGTLTPGTLSQFVLYSIFAAGALAGISQVWGEISLASGAAERLIELLSTEISVTAPKNPQNLPHHVEGRVHFDKVSFRFPAFPEIPVLHDISFQANSGESLAVVGPTGSGKSTLFSLLMRNYNLNSGMIKIDDVPISEVEPIEVRKKIAIVPQDTVIFSTTVMENIRFGRPDASDDEVREAAALAQAEEFVSAMSNGFDTIVGERGVTISGGQRQRIAIARAILKNAPILLLDEATSALDAESEQKIQIALEQLMKGRTTLVIAHRLSTVLRADKILVMDEGRIKESGTHTSLLKEDGLYARLAKIQFDKNVKSDDM